MSLNAADLAAAKQQAGKPTPPKTPSCLRCGHLRICAIFRAVGPLMGNWPDGDRPFEAEDVAKICESYAETFIAIRQSGAGDGQ